MIPIAQPQIGAEEQAAVREVLASGQLAQGARVAAFEAAFAAYTGAAHAIATNSGTSALHTALLAHGIGPGDEVITSPFTFIATANSILFTGARPVFVDIEPRSFNLDPRLVAAAITPRTRAILPVHLFGLPSPMDALGEIAGDYGLLIVEDACQAHGARYQGRMAGTFGTGTFSFYPTKNMTCGEGGMITTNDSQLADRCRAIRQHGVGGPGGNHSAKGRYQHGSLGFNYRLSDLHAAIGLEQLKKLPAFNRARQSNAAYLDAHLGAASLSGAVTTPYVPPECEHVYHQYTLRLPAGQRDRLLDHLNARGIGATVYYPVPLHMQPYYREVLGYNVSLPVAEQAALEVLSLPVHPGVGKEQLQVLVNEVNAFMA